MTGGINVPPVEAQASTAPAYCAGYPALFIELMVMRPVDSTLEITEPDSEPNSALEMIATLADPPRPSAAARKLEFIIELHVIEGIASNIRARAPSLNLHRRQKHWQIAVATVPIR